MKIHESWKEVLAEEFEKPYFERLKEYVRQEYGTQVCYPPGRLIFEAFNQTPFEEVKVVILGQDPYHGPGQAHGLSFSVPPGVAFPPSLRNIFKELKDDVGKEVPMSGDLTEWARQGVLLLNATLSVRAGQAGSHQNQGWETFTDAVIHLLNQRKENLVFLLWGAYAQNKGKFIDPNRHLVLKAKHPSPLSANSGGWFGTKHFSKTNEYLQQLGKPEIKW
ncbi:uracil-DNA glycosylase [Leadbetterella byssophila]|uniref:Uracil-DNA glycosylase n=1 Tax=Leadbetterella byssophila (strain DSM 17132 / JCM 16389 / KACC 11308 / NBRC 106382 / 4M15) TaxID=649349 RepID=E4RY07_LEAB4|nr:uracil-DNA glycosylase [Leadbetterella byssophila]ADQ16335.1 Uracil-DNA glycosylase [Leadbetterella byssophila DSM 17132]